MCMFTALSMSVIQLVSIAVIKIRNDLGSVSPEDIMLISFIFLRPVSGNGYLVVAVLLP